MEFLDKVLGRNAKETQLQNEIKSLQLRKEAVTSVFQKEISQLQSERSNILFQAGIKAYEDWCKNESRTDSLECFWEQIKGLETIIAEKQEKMQELETRYDEEISLIKKDLNNGIDINVKGKVCPKCNAQVGEEDLFCEKCGTKVG